MTIRTLALACVLTLPAMTASAQAPAEFYKGRQVTHADRRRRRRRL